MKYPLALAVLAAAVAFAVSPFFVSGFNGFTPDQFPIPQENPAVQPAGYAFSIWGLIYLWLIAGAVWGLLRKGRDTDWDRMRPALIASLALGAIWLPVAQASPVWATVLIWMMLASALAALSRAPLENTGWARLPVGLYAGWLTAASFVALGLVLAGHGVVSQQMAAVMLLPVAAIFAGVVARKMYPAPTYTLAVIWALIAVAVRNTSDNTTVTLLALVASLALAVSEAMALRRR